MSGYFDPARHAARRIALPWTRTLRAGGDFIDGAAYRFAMNDSGKEPRICLASVVGAAFGGWQWVVGDEFGKSATRELAKAKADESLLAQGFTLMAIEGPVERD